MSATTDMDEEATLKSMSYNPCLNKRARTDGHVYGSKFKGVVALRNGKWGAQIYANQQRIWLGTFKSENEAAKAYDSAAIKLRIFDSYRNFSWSNINAQEPIFQSQFSKEDVICMIKDGSYPSKYADYLKLQYQPNNLKHGLNLSTVEQNKGEFLCSRLFEKELTPSDVGCLNRLVIPKKHALSYFPCLSCGSGNEASAEVDDEQLVFYDRSMRPWRFRYCYWKSSQSYVFTRGWSEFVRQKKLKWKDIISFYTYSYAGEANLVTKLLVIDVAYYSEKQNNDTKGQKNEEPEKVLAEINSKADGQKKGFKLFGVQIMEEGCNS